MPSTVRPLLAGQIFFSVLAGACKFGTAWAGLRPIHHHQRNEIAQEPLPHNSRPPSGAAPTCGERLCSVALLIIIGGLFGAVLRGWRLRPSCRARRQRRRCQRQRYAPCRRPCAARRPTSPRPAGCAPGGSAAQRKRERGGGERAKKTTRFAQRARISRRNKLSVIRAAMAGRSVTIVLLLLITLKGLSPEGGGSRVSSSPTPRREDGIMITVAEPAARRVAHL